MKTNFFDKKLFIIFISSIVFISVLGFLINFFYMYDKIKSQVEAEKENPQIQRLQTSDGLYDYYIFNINNEEEVYITNYEGNEKKVETPTKIDGIAVTEIGDGCFTNTYNLTAVTVPNGIISLGICSFAGCKNLKSITISNTVSQIGYNSFIDCDKVTIYCPKSSFAENYAIENNLKYENVIFE